MPEIAEVSIITEQLDFYLSGRELKNIINPTGKYETVVLEMKPVLPLYYSKIFNKGKQIIFTFSKSYKGDECYWLFVSLGMTGGFGDTQVVKHSHLCFVNEESIFGFDHLFYTNVRTIGGYITFISKYEVYQNKLDSLASPIGLGPNVISLDELKNNIKRSKNRLFANCLMDQKSVCSGIGNYLLSEIFYACGLNPYVKCGELSDELVDRFYTKANLVIKESYDKGGVSVRDYRDTSGTKGEYQKELKVYGKKVDPSGNKVVRIIGPHNRSFWYVKEIEGEIPKQFLKARSVARPGGI